MARKKEDKPMPATAESETKAVRLELRLDLHRKLRVEAARRDVPMAELVRSLVEEFLKDVKD